MLQKRSCSICALAALLLITVSMPAAGDLRDSLSRLLGGSSGGPTNAQMAEGVREALAQGGERAIRTLGRKNGFFGNPRVRIPIPRQLHSLESALRRLGQGRAVDHFVRTLNRAAERAVPLAADVVRGTIRHMTVRDAVNIVRGPDDAATRYLRAHAGKRLRRLFLPIVRETTAHVGVTREYKRLVARAGPMARLLGIKDLDLDRYVTERTVNGLFRVIAQEEKRIREHPVARTTELLKQVFGSG